MFYHCFLISTYSVIFMKGSYVILVNLASLPIEVTGCMINDQELFPSRERIFFSLLCPGHLWGLSSW